MTGMLIIARYDERRGCIEAYRLVAEHGKHTFESWDYLPDVIIHTFSPNVQLWLDDPIVKLDLDLERRNNLKSRAKEETSMQRGPAHTSKISLCQAIPLALQHPSMALWPPKIIPAKDRVRSESGTMFRDAAHKPGNLAQASDQTFRVRKYLDFLGQEQYLGIRMGEDVLTFSTLLEDSYTPTENKPWQGIWVGDYSGHGCEFLLVLQKDHDPGVRPIRASHWSPFPLPSSTDEEDEADDLDFDPVGESSSSSGFSVYNTGYPADNPLIEEPDDNPVPSCRGRLEAIKLTGDPNVPRGQYTWIAEDIGPRGFIRQADEQMFKGARVVRSLGMGIRRSIFGSANVLYLGHCAARHFKHGKPPENYSCFFTA